MPTVQTTFTLCELHDLVRGEIGMRGSNLITDSDLTSWAQRIVRQSAHETQWHVTTDTVDSAADTADYDVPTGAIALKAVYFDDFPLEEISFHDLIERYPYWRSQGSVARPWCWYRKGLTSYSLFPAPDATTADVIRLYTSSIPAMPASNSDTFDFPPQNEGLLIAYCCYRASMKDANGEGGKRVQQYEREYLAELERMKAAVADFGEAELFVLGMDSDRRNWRDFRRQVVSDPYA